MKVVFIGGGSYRTLPIVRAAMATRGVLDGGEVQLLDLNLERAETVGRLIMKTPEYRKTGCRVGWTNKANRALEGADVVSLSMPVGSHSVCRLSDQASRAHGFHGGDQLSVSGAFRSLTGGRIVLDYARRMEKCCPKAWFVDFANPVAVYSGMLNNHTQIRALGICGGFSNHRWDLTRLMGRDAYSEEYAVVAAGVNHLSFILRGTYNGEDLYRVLGRHLTKTWKPPRITTHPHMAKYIQYGLRKLAEMYHRLGFIIFSTEGDGMIHLFFDEMMARDNKTYKPASLAQIRAEERSGRKRRQEYDRQFHAYLDQDLDDAFWAQSALKNPWFGRSEGDATVLILKGLAGVAPVKLVASRTNQGAVKGFKDRTVLEYSMTLTARGVKPAPDMEVPDPVHGLISSLATHQTLLGDAVATRDPKVLADALFAYPLFQNTHQARDLFRALLRIHADEIDPVFQKAKDYL